MKSGLVVWQCDPPTHLETPLMPYVQLTSEERYVIYHLKLYKLSQREIARRLGRHHSTISRELKRNGPAFPLGSTGSAFSSNPTGFQTAFVGLLPDL